MMLLDLDINVGCKKYLKLFLVICSLQRGLTSSSASELELALKIKNKFKLI